METLMMLIERATYIINSSSKLILFIAIMLVIGFALYTLYKGIFK